MLGELYSLLRNCDLQFIIFKRNIFLKKNCSEGKNIQLKACTKPLLEDANYDLESDVSRNILSRLKLCECSEIVYYIVRYDRDFPVIESFYEIFSATENGT